MMRKVGVVTGTRAEYGLLRWVIHGISAAPDLQLQLIATGTHLSPEFGLTYQEIERDGFHIDRRIELLLSSDSPVGIAKSIGLGTIGFADALGDLSPDVLVVLGDRFEILAAATAALTARIPLAHIHGGESSVGVIDEAIRHALTKMSHVHFVAAEDYRRRVIQLGEAPERVFLVGGLGVDSVRRLQLLERHELEESLGFKLGSRNLLVTFHPVTLEHATAAEQLKQLLAALDTFQNTHLIFTQPNADTGGRVLTSLIQEFVHTRPHTKFFTSLGQLRYLSAMKHVDGVVGNSSSGLIEAPALGTGTIDIGDRQRGRLKASSVIECAPEQGSIESALRTLYSAEFQEALRDVRNPYGDGGASERIVQTLRQIRLDGLLKKQFYDLPLPELAV